MHSSEEPRYIYLEHRPGEYNITKSNFMVAGKDKIALIHGTPKSLDKILSTSSAGKGPLVYFRMEVESIVWFGSIPGITKYGYGAFNGLCSCLYVERSRYWDGVRCEWR